MTSTLPPDPPNFPGINYNSSFWSNASATGLTYNQALKNFLAFPVAQGTETLQNTSVNGTLTIINPTTPGETYTQYIDPTPQYDVTISTNQTAGGLTVRTPTNSFTMNPNSFNINLTTPTLVTGAQLLNPINMNNFNIVNMGQYSTAYTQANNTNLDYVATCNYVNNMIVNGNGILDNNNVWTGSNTFNGATTLASPVLNGNAQSTTTPQNTNYLAIANVNFVNNEILSTVETLYVNEIITLTETSPNYTIQTNYNKFQHIYFFNGTGDYIVSLQNQLGNGYINIQAITVNATPSFTFYYGTTFPWTGTYKTISGTITNINTNTVYGATYYFYPTYFQVTPSFITTANTTYAFQFTISNLYI
jgi:hypothetical protein